MQSTRKPAISAYPIESSRFLAGYMFSGSVWFGYTRSGGSLRPSARTLRHLRETVNYAGRHRIIGFRAAVTSSTLVVRVMCGAFSTVSGSVSTSLAIAIIASTN